MSSPRHLDQRRVVPRDQRLPVPGGEADDGEALADAAPVLRDGGPAEGGTSISGGRAPRRRPG